jgi:hypothetical protein
MCAPLQAASQALKSKTETIYDTGSMPVYPCTIALYHAIVSQALRKALQSASFLERLQVRSFLLHNDFEFFNTLVYSATLL